MDLDSRCRPALLTLAVHFYGMCVVSHTVISSIQSLGSVVNDGLLLSVVLHVVKLL